MAAKYKLVRMTVHAAERAAKWNISGKQTLRIIEHGEMIEEYPDDPRGRSCLLLGFVGTRPVHVCVGIANEPELCEIITVYEPTLDVWHEDYRTRRHAS